MERSRSAEGHKSLEKARQALAWTDPDLSVSDAALTLDNALAYAHSALNALLRQYRMPTQDPAAFAGFYDVAGVPFRELI